MKFKTRFFLSFIATAIMIAVMLVQGGPLKIPSATPAGIVNMELARTVTHAASIIKAWSPTLISTAFSNIYIDFIFILCYSFFLFTVCQRIYKQSTGNHKKVSRLLCYAIIIAGLFDVFENILMLRILNGHISNEVVASTFFFSSVKFFLLSLALLFIAFYFLARLLARKPQEEISIV